MVDDLTKKGSEDRSRINVNEDNEVRYWTRELCVTEARLREAVVEVGGNVIAVRNVVRYNAPAVSR